MLLKIVIQCYRIFLTKNIALKCFVTFFKFVFHILLLYYSLQQNDAIKMELTEQNRTIEQLKADNAKLETENRRLMDVLRKLESQVKDLTKERGKYTTTFTSQTQNIICTYSVYAFFVIHDC